jgi:hypothetical protein
LRRRTARPARRICEVHQNFRAEEKAPVTDFGVKVDPLNAAITLIYKHGFKLHTKIDEEKTVGNPLPEISSLLKPGLAWSTSKKDLAISSVFVSKAATDRKREVTNVPGQGKAGATGYAKKHKLDALFDRIIYFPYSFKANVRYLNEKYFNEILDMVIGQLNRTYDSLQNSLADEQKAKNDGKDASEYRSQVITLHDKLERIQLALLELVKTHEKTYGKSYFYNFRVYRRDRHGDMKLGGPQNAALEVSFTISANKDTDVPGISVVAGWEERAPLRPTRFAGGRFEFRNGELFAAKGEMGRVFAKFAKTQDADVAAATPKETTEQLRQRLASLPAWQFMVEHRQPPTTAERRRVRKSGNVAALAQRRGTRVSRSGDSLTVASESAS